MQKNNLSASAEYALGAIEKAKWESQSDLSVVCMHGVPLIVTAEAFAARQKVPGGFRIEYESGAFDVFPAENVKKALKLGKALPFDYSSYGAQLFENGMLKVGCLLRKLNDFLPGGEGEENYVVATTASEDRTALVAALKKRLTARKAQLAAAKLRRAAKKVTTRKRVAVARRSTPRTSA